MASLSIGTATFTNGSRLVSMVTLTNGTVEFMDIGTSVAIGADPVSRIVAAAPRQAGDPVNSFRLDSPWQGATDTYSFFAMDRIEGFVKAIEDARFFADQLSGANAALAALANIYDTVQDGLNDTVTGDIFSVAGEGDVFITLYLNNNGAAEEQESLPSMTLIQSAVSAAGDAQGSASSALASKQHIDELFAEFGVTLDSAINGGQ